MVDGEQSVPGPSIAPPVTEFRFSARRQIGVSAVVLLAYVAALIAASLALGLRWWRMLPLYGLILVFSAVRARSTKSGRPRLPLRLTDRELQLTGPDGSTLAIDPSNIEHAYIHGRWMPYLVVKVVDPSQTRPPLPLWKGSKPGQLRPDEIAVPLSYMTPGRDVLSRELARRFPNTARA